MNVDPVTLNIAGKGLLAIAREMAANMRRASYSTVVREARDFSVGILDTAGNVVAQAKMIPMQTGGISEAFKPVAARFDWASLTTDDAFIMNDPFSGGQHLQDIFLFTPIFAAGHLIAFAASVAHHVEISGGQPGLNAEATEFYQEGLRLPASRFSISRDWSGGFVETFIRANVRVPDKVLGDLNAQFAANNTADRRINEIVKRHGSETILEVMASLQDYSELRMREAIEQIPDGVYDGEDFVEARPWGMEPVKIAATVEVRGSSIHVDFAGSGDQVPANINCPYASTISAVQGAVRGVLRDRDIPFNEGCNRPISVEIPYGSILHPRPPAAVRARMSPALRVHNAVIRALSQAVPEQVIAPGFDTTTAISLSHLQPETGNYGVVIEILGGGWGAGPRHDGMDALDNPLSNCANAPVEALEIECDYFRVDRYLLRTGSGGDGRQRGGLGIERAYTALKDGVAFSGYSDRHDAGVQGLFGGDPGGTGAFLIRRADGIEETLPCVASAKLNTGDTLISLTGGGGGFGPSSEREPSPIARSPRPIQSPRMIEGNPTMAKQFTVDPALVEQYVTTLAQYGAHGDTGVWRPVYGEAWTDAQRQIEAWCREAGMDVRWDAVGNVWGRVEGTEGGEVIVTGSHVDSQLPGGRFDGALGVISGILALKALTERFGQPRRTLEVVSFCEEESSRFPTAHHWGSRAVAGAIEPEDLELVVSFEGEPIGEVMRVAGFDPVAVADARRDDIETFVELHIEQGPILEQENVPVAVVSGITGIRHYRIELHGRADHAGARPMDLRRDPMACAAEIISTAIATAHRMGRPAVTTVGRIEVEPNGASIVPERVSFTIDARHPDPEARELLYARHEAMIREVASRRDIDVTWQLGAEQPPRRSDPELVQIFQDAAREEDLTYLTMDSGAVHDANRMAGLAKMVMLFVQSKDGRSHTPDEYTSPTHAAAGIELLAAGLHKLAY